MLYSIMTAVGSPSVQCFAAGAVAGGHKRDHPYQLIVSGCILLRDGISLYSSTLEVSSPGCECLLLVCMYM